MKKRNSKKISYLIIILVFLIIASAAGLMYWKIERIIHSISDSAQKANSQNTPLSD